MRYGDFSAKPSPRVVALAAIDGLDLGGIDGYVDGLEALGGGQGGREEACALKAYNANAFHTIDPDEQVYNICCKLSPLNSEGQSH